MPLKYKIEVQPLALQDMRQAVLYIAEDLRNPGAATRMAEEFVRGIESLANIPTRCPLYVPRRRLNYEYRKLRIGSYLAFFRVSEQDETVTVARVLYGRRDVDELLS